MNTSALYLIIYLQNIKRKVTLNQMQTYQGLLRVVLFFIGWNQKLRLIFIFLQSVGLCVSQVSTP